MSKTDLSSIADLAAPGGTPQAGILTPEVRSGSSFTYAPAVPTPLAPCFLVVWFYKVKPTNRDNFVAAVTSYEGSGVLPVPATGLTYRGTYSVSISAAAPDFEYRTYWGLSDLTKLDVLNSYLRSGAVQLVALLKLIEQEPAMRSEIMGFTSLSAPAVGSSV